MSIDVATDDQSIKSETISLNNNVTSQNDEVVENTIQDASITPPMVEDAQNRKNLLKEAQQDEINTKSALLREMHLKKIGVQHKRQGVAKNNVDEEASKSNVEDLQSFLNSDNKLELEDTKDEKRSDSVLPPNTIIPSTSTVFRHNVLKPANITQQMNDTLRSPSYRLLEHLHKLGYFFTPGLRFGGRYNAYPGDPLRYHSHFTCVPKGFGEEFLMRDLIGGGRLGTNVKKAWLIGAHDEDKNQYETFTIEWSGFG